MDSQIRKQEIVCPKCGDAQEPTGSHEDDSGERDCEACGFTFDVYIDYDPTYTATCKEHVFGDWSTHQARTGEIIEVRICQYCGVVGIKP